MSEDPVTFPRSRYPHWRENPNEHIQCTACGRWGFHGQTNWGTDDGRLQYRCDVCGNSWKPYLWRRATWRATGIGPEGRRRQIPGWALVLAMAVCFAVAAFFGVLTLSGGWTP